ncbi:MAG: permease [Rhodocyclaceae bacterium]|jgi:drug/metabolite transporter (DMT)-like permease|nr:permease [Rhodocyclaceae bacterium]
MLRTKNAAAIVALLAGATVWGLIWHPYRVLERAGVSAATAATLTYFVAFLLGLIFLRRSLAQLRPSWALAFLALAAGGCNLGYVLATVHGEVMRVMLLFYLAPLWTVLLSRLLLGERLYMAGTAVIGLSIAGAVVMLWQSRQGLPVPKNGAEWLGLAAGFFFALTNVLIRRTAHLSIEIKSMAVFAGVVAVGLCVLPFEPGPVSLPTQPLSWTLVLAVGAVLLVINLVVQYGLTRTPANQAIVIFLFELVVAAVSSWLLAGEAMGVKEWLGGAMIVVASLFSGRLEEPRKG